MVPVGAASDIDAVKLLLANSSGFIRVSDTSTEVELFFTEAKRKKN